MIPFFLTVDTEGDNIWSRPSVITAENTSKLYRFQELCEKYKIKPIYLTNYEAAINENYKIFIDEHKKNLEVGLHLHAWNSPPEYKLTIDDYRFQPYLHEYPEDVIKQKIDFMVSLLENRFNTKIISHRGGRYSINSIILKALRAQGIKVDCSVVPGIDWRTSMGSPTGHGGPNFKESEANIHFLKEDLYEIPVSTYRINNLIDTLSDKNLIKRGLSKIFEYKTSILRSKIDNLNELKKIVEWNIKNDTSHLEYIIHSSELVKGGSPLINSTKDEDLFYTNLEEFFIFLKKSDVVSYTFNEWLNEEENK